MDWQPLCHEGMAHLRHTPAPSVDTVGEEKPAAAPLDLLDELELLLRRKGRLPVLLVTVIALALCFLVVGIVMATGIMLVTFFLFVSYSETPPAAGTLDILGKTL